MTVALILPTYRPGSGGQETWDDLRVCLASIAAYGRGIEVVVAWDGPCPPDDLPRNTMCRVLRRPDGMTSSMATQWAWQQTDASDFVIVSDDVVLAPDSLRKLFEDATLIYEQGHKIGVLACRSNFAPGPQNIRAANGGTWLGGIDGYDSEATVFQADRVSPFCALLPRAAAETVSIPEVEWYNDDLGCYDLMRAGFTNWISRSYVHHVGMRSSAGTTESQSAVMQRMNEEALSWIRVNRPDFWQYLQNGRRMVEPNDLQTSAPADQASRGAGDTPTSNAPARAVSARRSGGRPSGRARSRR